MNAAGIDVSSSKSTVAVLRPFGEVVKLPFNVRHSGDVVLLQNTRFRKEETKNMPEFSEELASLAKQLKSIEGASSYGAHRTLL